MTESNDYEWLLARERGEDVSYIPEHRRERYGQLDRLIHDLPMCAPSPGWKQRVLDCLDDPLVADRPRTFPWATARSRVAAPRRSPSPPPRRWAWALGSGFAASLAAVFAVCAYLHDPTAPEAPQVAVPVVTHGERPIEVLQTIEESSPTAPFAGTSMVGVRRAARRHRGGGTAPHIGDSLVVETTADRPIELRVYGDSGEPLARCMETQGCRVEHIGARRKYHLELRLHAPGEVRMVEYTGAAMPDALVSLDEDLEAASKAGADVKELATVHVE